MKNALKTIGRLILGILAIVLMFYLITEFNQNFLKIHNVSSLKWFYIITFLPGFILAGIINRKTKLIFLPFLFIPIFLFIYLKSYSSTMLMVILFCTAGLLITRKEINWKIKLPLSVILTFSFIYYLFSQPLILEKDGFGYMGNNLVNARVVWDFSNKIGEIKKLPNQTFFDKNGKEVTLNDFKGKNLYITFWATNCGSCLLEKPLLEEYKTKYTNPDLVFIDISLDNNKNKWKSYLEEHNPQGIQLIAKNDADTKIKFGFGGIPYTIIVDTTGVYKEWQRPSMIEAIEVVNLLEHTEDITEYVNTPMYIFETVKNEKGEPDLKRVR